MFFREIASIFAQKISTVFLRLLRAELFPSQWCSVDVVPIPKRAMSFLLSVFRPISIKLVQFEVHEYLVSSRLSYFMEAEGVSPRHQYANRKSLGTCNAL